MFHYARLWLLPAFLMAVIFHSDPIPALTVYDCAHEDTTFEPLDLNEPAPCLNPDTDFHPASIRRVQLLHTDSALPVLALQCKVNLSTDVCRCGYDSLSYGCENTNWEKLLEISPAECARIHRTGKYRAYGRTFLIQLGVAQHHEFYSKGDYAGGSCTTANFISNGKEYWNSYEKTTLDIKFSEIHAAADLTKQDGVVTFPRFDNLRVTYGHKMVRDVDAGLLIWEAARATCEDTVSQVYLGEGLLHRVKTHTIRGSILLVADNKTDQAAGLVLEDPIYICSFQCFGTQIEGLVACLHREGDEEIPEHSFKSVFRDGDRIDLEAQVSRAVITLTMKLTAGFREMANNICHVARTTMANKLIAVLGTANEYALFDIHGKGAKVIASGTSAYIARCVPSEATRVDYDVCTEEVPVRLNNKTMFADAVNWIVKEYPTIVPCSSVMPIRWRINEKWICATPTTAFCTAPTILNVTHVKVDNKKPFDLQLGHGVFTDSQLAQHREFVNTLDGRRPTLAHITMAATAAVRTDGSVGSPISAMELSEIRDNVATHFFPLIAWFGKAYIYAYGFLMIFVVVALLAGSTLRAYILFRQHGIGWWMVGALWATAFSVVVFHLNMVREAARAAENPLEDPTTAILTPRTDSEIINRLLKDIEGLNLRQDYQDHRLDKQEEKACKCKCTCNTKDLYPHVPADFVIDDAV